MPRELSAGTGVGSTAIRAGAIVAVALATIVLHATAAGQNAAPGGRASFTVRPAMLAAVIGQVAGHRVEVPDARVFWVIDSRALVIEADTRFEPLSGFRDRVLVLLERGSLAIPRPPVKSAPIRVIGEARTLLGVQAGGGPAWPAALTHELVERLEIRAAIIASSVQTPEGIELTAAQPF